MSDFFSFEYFDELPEPNTGIEDTGGNYRRNQSLSASSAEYLREAMKRLVPSTYVYGESGIGDRAYELYGLCVSHAFTGHRSNHLIAAICVMHASYERRSDLVILPSDIQAAYADKQLKVCRINYIQSMYYEICLLLKLPHLQVSMEKVFDRIFRQCGKVESEREITEFVQTALAFEKELRKLTDESKVVSAKNGKPRFQSTYQVETIAAVASVLACRYHNYSKVTAQMIQAEMHIVKGTMYHLLNKYREKFPSEEPIEGKRGRKDPFKIGGVEVRSGLGLVATSFIKSQRNQRSNEQVLQIASTSRPSTRYRDPNDPLSFLFNAGASADASPSASAIPDREASYQPTNHDRQPDSTSVGDFADLLADVPPPPPAETKKRPIDDISALFGDDFADLLAPLPPLPESSPMADNDVPLEEEEEEEEQDEEDEYDRGAQSDYD